MTPRQITRKLEKANFNMAAAVEIGRDEITIGVLAANNECDREATEAALDHATEILGWGGFSCAWGGWVLRAGYQSHGYDYNDPASPDHY